MLKSWNKKSHCPKWYERWYVWISPILTAYVGSSWSYNSCHQINDFWLNPNTSFGWKKNCQYFLICGHHLWKLVSYRFGLAFFYIWTNKKILSWEPSCKKWVYLPSRWVIMFSSATADEQPGDWHLLSRGTRHDQLTTKHDPGSGWLFPVSVLTKKINISIITTTWRASWLWILVIISILNIHNSSHTCMKKM